jgi:crotonobetainyl-CoA:carnitine CoA-transferase CaiB-like acyl-CoA transferase
MCGLISNQLDRKKSKSMGGPLSGIKILDLSRLLPGPLCTHLLTRLGATVVKVDQPDGGDYVRYLPPMVKCVHPNRFIVRLIHSDILDFLMEPNMVQSSKH